MESVDPTRLRVEIAEETLARLLANGQVCAADLRCLDCRSKKCLWLLCLKSCSGQGLHDLKDKIPHNNLCRACRRFLRGCSNKY
jgi:hypothetical protein